MTTRIAVCLSDEQLARIDAAVAQGHFPSRAAAVRAGVERVLRERRDLEIAEAYRRGYGGQPQERDTGKLGLTLGQSSCGEKALESPEIWASSGRVTERGRP
jgi:Arc/MetJ-type ribon-helix-helix transcriptional regulator